MSATWTILGVLDWTTKRFASAGIGAARLEAQVLLAHALRCSRMDLYTGFDGPSDWGGGDVFRTTSQSGGAFAIIGAAGPFQPNAIGVPTGYVSGTPLSSTMTFANQTVAGMGFDQGRYVYTLPNDRLTVDIGVVPEPATWAMMLVGFGAAGAALRRRRRAILVA